MAAVHRQVDGDLEERGEKDVADGGIKRQMIYHRKYNGVDFVSVYTESLACYCCLAPDLIFLEMAQVFSTSRDTCLTC